MGTPLFLFFRQDTDEAGVDFVFVIGSPIENAGKANPVVVLVVYRDKMMRRFVDASYVILASVVVFILITTSSSANSSSSSSSSIRIMMLAVVVGIFPQPFGNVGSYRIARGTALQC